MIKNPLTEGMLHIKEQFSELEFTAKGFFPSILIGVILLVLIIIFVVLWPYGLFAVMEDFVRGFMRNTRDKMEDKSTIAKMPFVVALGLYFMVWIPFAILCLPFVIIGAIGRLFAK